MVMNIPFKFVQHPKYISVCYPCSVFTIKLNEFMNSFLNTRSFSMSHTIVKSVMLLIKFVFNGKKGQSVNIDCFRALHNYLVSYTLNSLTLELEISQNIKLGSLSYQILGQNLCLCFSFLFYFDIFVLTFPSIFVRPVWISLLTCQK